MFTDPPRARRMPVATSRPGPRHEPVPSSLVAGTVARGGCARVRRLRCCPLAGGRVMNGSLISCPTLCPNGAREAPRSANRFGDPILNPRCSEPGTLLPPGVGRRGILVGGGLAQRLAARPDCPSAGFLLPPVCGLPTGGRQPLAVARLFGADVRNLHGRDARLVSGRHQSRRSPAVTGQTPRSLTHACPTLWPSANRLGGPGAH
jgi:hypothetical protein